MKAKNLLTTLAALAVSTFLGVSSAHAQVEFTWQSGSAWETSTWNCSGCGISYPNNPNHIAIFQGTGSISLTIDDANSVTVGEVRLVSNGGTHSTVTLTSDDGTNVATLIIDTGADTDGKVAVAVNNTLNLGARMKLEYDDADQPSEIGGNLRLTTDSSVLRVDDDVVLGPHSTSNGFVVGLDAAAAIEIGNGLELTIEDITVRGILVIRPASGTAVLMNQGVINADGGGVLQLALGLMLTDTAGLRWKASGAGAALEFRQLVGQIEDPGTDNLFGNFAAADCGALSFFKNVVTRGSLSLVGTTHTGAVIVDQGDAPCFYYDWVDEFDVNAICTDIDCEPM